MENLDEIVALLTEIGPTVSEPEEIKGLEPDIAEVKLWRRHRVTVDPQDLQRLVAAIRRVPDLAALEGGYSINSPGSLSSIQLEALAHWMLAQGRNRAPAQVMDMLTTALRKNEASMLEFIPIWGISPKQEISLGDGLKIVPIQSLPGSRLKDIFTNIRRHAFTFEMANLFARPGAAVTKETTHGPIYLRADSPAAQPVKDRMNLVLELVTPILRGAEAPEKLMQKLAADMGKERLQQMRESTSIGPIAEELCLVVALCIDRPIFPVGQAYQLHEDLPLAGSPAGYGGPTNDLPFTLAIQPMQYPIEEIEGLVARYLALNPQVRKRLKTPLQRLNAGRKQIEMGSVEGAALDLGISAEALLTQERDSDAPLAFTVRARGTLLMAGTSEEKRANYQTLKDLYSLRSKVAHEGAVADHTVLPLAPAEQMRVNKAWETVRNGEILCISMLRKIIETASFPSWDDLMFQW